MEEIRELVKIITNHTKKNLPLLDLKAQQENDNKELKLFLGVKSGEYDTDEKASQGVYGDNGVDFKFRMLKSRLNRKLLNHLFFMDFGTNKSQKSNALHQECLDYLHFARMLLKVGELKYASKLLYKTIDLAKECEFTDVAISCLVEMRDIYATTYRPKLFQNIQQQILEYKELLVKEEKANEIYFEHKLSLNSTITNRKKDFEPVEEGIQQLDAIYKATQSFNVYTKYLKLSLWHYELTGDFEKVLELIESTENAYKKGKLNATRFNRAILNVSKLYAHLKLGHIDEGMMLAKKYLKDTDKDNTIWLAYMENYMLLCLKSKQYEQAGRLMREVLSSKTFDQIEEQLLEKWNVYRAYLYLLTGDKYLIRKFDFHAYTTEIPTFEKEKAGINVAILNLQFLVHLDGDLDTLHNIVNAMDEYVSKYLNNSFSKKTKIFYKLIGKVAQYNRDFDTLLQKSKYLTEKLLETEEEGDAFANLDVVPYEHLWEMIIKRLSVLRYQNV